MKPSSKLCFRTLPLTSPLRARPGPPGNDAQTKAEGKYDTRSIEENYLADGQSKQALVARQAHAAIASLSLTASDGQTPITVGSLIKVAFPMENVWFFLAPAAGGLEVAVDGNTITVLTSESPLGSQLLGLRAGEKTIRPETKILKVL